MKIRNYYSLISTNNIDLIVFFGLGLGLSYSNLGSMPNANTNNRNTINIALFCFQLTIEW